MRHRDGAACRSRRRRGGPRGWSSRSAAVTANTAVSAAAGLTRGPAEAAATTSARIAAVKAGEAQAETAGSLAAVTANTAVSAAAGLTRGPAEAAATTSARIAAVDYAP